MWDIGYEVSETRCPTSQTHMQVYGRLFSPLVLNGIFRKLNLFPSSCEECWRITLFAGPNLAIATSPIHVRVVTGSVSGNMCSMLNSARWKNCRN